MKQNKFRLFSSMLLALVLLLSMAVTAYAKDSSVTYEGGAEKFVFLSGSDYSETDLFDNFKGVMPGDTLTQKVTVKNDYRGSDKVKIYMRAETHEEDDSWLSDSTEAAIANAVSMADFLHQLSMTVKNGDEVIYDANVDELDGLEKNVLLGTFYPGQQIELTVELNVPIELGNEYANRIGEVDWVFVAEEINDPDPEPDKPDTPGEPGTPEEPEVQRVVVKNTVVQPVIPILPDTTPTTDTSGGASTGDSTSAAGWAVLGLLAAAALIGLWIYKSGLSGEKKNG